MLSFRASVRELQFRDTLRGSDVLSNTVGNEMTYRISYDDGLAAMAGARDDEGVRRTEFFPPNMKRYGGRASCSRTAIIMASRCATVLAASWRAFGCN
jgi:hypothetical protein